MIPQWTRAARRVLTASGAAVVAVLALAMPAAAHEPVLLDRSDAVPWNAPIAVNGEDPISFFGVLPRAGAARSFQLTMRAGQHLTILYMVPDLAPENQLSDGFLPRIMVVSPSHHVTVIEPTVRVSVPIPELDQNYLMLADHEGTAEAGVYSVLVTGLAPARFNISTGIEGGDFHGILRGKVASLDQIAEWYSTAP